jgi:signal transduction histidine kinase
MINSAKTIQLSFLRVSLFYLGFGFSFLFAADSVVDVSFRTLIEKKTLGNNTDQDSNIITDSKEDKISLTIDSNLRAANQALQQGDWQKSLRLYSRSKDLSNANDLEVLYARSLTGLGKLYLREGEMFELSSAFENADKSYSRAKIFFEKAYTIYSKNKQQQLEASLLSNLGITNYRLYQNNQALKNLNHSLRLFQNLNADSLSASVMLNKGVVHESMGNLDSAAYCFKQAKFFFKSSSNLVPWLSADINLASIARSKGKLRQAVTLLREADSLAKVVNTLERRVMIQQELYSIYKSNDQIRDALNAFEFYQKLKDSILNRDFKTEELQVRYETAKKNETIERQRSRQLQQALAVERAQWDRLVLILLLTIVAAVSLVVVGVLRWRQKKARILNAHKNQLQEEKIHNLNRSKQLETANALLKGQETERIRVAKDLHDRLGSTLIGVKMQLEMVTSSNETKLNKARNFLDQAIGETREIAHNMISGVLLTLGLKSALVELKENVENFSALNIYLKLDNFSIRLEKSVEIELYRIIQELMNNTLKHANANTVNLTIEEAGDYLEVIFRDDGKGFNVDEIDYGLGLNNIERRLAALNGHVEKMETKPGEGTCFKIILNIPHE